MSVSELSELGDTQVEMDRRRQERRLEENGTEAREAKPEKKVRKQRRRQIDPTTCERDYNSEEIAFMLRSMNTNDAAVACFPLAVRSWKSFVRWAMFALATTLLRNPQLLKLKKQRSPHKLLSTQSA